MAFNIFLPFLVKDMITTKKIEPPPPESEYVAHFGKSGKDKKKRRMA